MNAIRVLLADDHPLILEGMRVLLAPHFKCVETVNDGRALVERALAMKPDLIVLDITMPLLNGIDAATQIRKRLPHVKLMFVTMHADPAYLQAALHAGATGYVLKSSAHAELLEACRAVLKGNIHVTPGLSSEHLERFHDPARAANVLRLSTRERETLQLIAEGKAAKEIAFILKISPKTVTFHRENVKRKLSLRTTAELTKHAIEMGLI